MWRGARWREEPQYKMRDGRREGKRLRMEGGRESCSMPPYFSCNRSCSLMCTNTAVGAAKIKTISLSAKTTGAAGQLNTEVTTIESVTNRSCCVSLPLA